MAGIKGELITYSMINNILLYIIFSYYWTNYLLLWENNCMLYIFTDKFLIIPFCLLFVDNKYCVSNRYYTF